MGIVDTRILNHPDLYIEYNYKPTLLFPDIKECFDKSVEILKLGYIEILIEMYVQIRLGKNAIATKDL